jgi:hypothetical protein
MGVCIVAKRACYLRHLCRSACTTVAPSGRISTEVYIRSFYEKSAKKIQNLLKSDFNIGHFTWGWAGQLSRYSDWLRAGRFGDRNPVGARFYTPVQTSPGDHPASCTMGTGSFPGVECGRGVTLTPYCLLVLRSKNRVELWVFSP